jgi:hypothetical protein
MSNRVVGGRVYRGQAAECAHGRDDGVAGHGRFGSLGRYSSCLRRCSFLLAPLRPRTLLVLLTPPLRRHAPRLVHIQHLDYEQHQQGGAGLGHELDLLLAEALDNVVSAAHHATSLYCGESAVESITPSGNALSAKSLHKLACELGRLGHVTHVTAGQLDQVPTELLTQFHVYLISWMTT